MLIFRRSRPLYPWSPPHTCSIYFQTYGQDPDRHQVFSAFRLQDGFLCHMSCLKSVWEFKGCNCISILNNIFIRVLVQKLPYLSILNYLLSWFSKHLLWKGLVCSTGVGGRHCYLISLDEGTCCLTRKQREPTSERAFMTFWMRLGCISFCL